MRIVQSFWSHDSSLIYNDFGWLSAQYHIMGWALSCLKLKEYYDDVHLYTDTNGSTILIDYLKLPYKTVNVCYDSINHYDKHLWALPKIMTYAAQEEPFIHVDGDVFIWNRFRSGLEEAGLVAQNLEKGTNYYKRFIGEVRDNLNYVPDFLNRELNKKSISSYNMGLFGGTDLQFIKKYCKAALELVDGNYSDPSISKDEAPFNFNILFEQILFYSLTRIENKKVACLFNKRYKDNGYASSEFADFAAVPYEYTYLHLIGRKKRDREICDLMSRILFRDYPEYFYKIIALFRDQHFRLYEDTKFFFSESNYETLSITNDRCPDSKCFPINRGGAFIMNKWDNKESYLNGIKSVKGLKLPLMVDVSRIENRLTAIYNEWMEISSKCLLTMENAAASYFGFFFKSTIDQLSTVLERNSYLEVIEESFKWSDDVKLLINVDLIDKNNVALGIAYVPQMFFEGYREIIIDEIDYNILAILDRKMPLSSVLLNLESCFKCDAMEQKNTIYNLVLLKLRSLLFNKCIFINNNIN